MGASPSFATGLGLGETEPLGEPLLCTAPGHADRGSVTEDYLSAECPQWKSLEEPATGLSSEKTCLDHTSQ
jgi:hypothetical protein